MISDPTGAIALVATFVVIAVMLGQVFMPRLERTLDARRHRRERGIAHIAHDPGRERRAELRARELLRSCVNDEEWDMYRDLGFIRVWGGQSTTGPVRLRRMRGVDVAYLVYPHRPLLAYVAQTGQLLSEYCVEFPDDTRPYGSPRLPDSDDVLAKWMALKADEQALISRSNMHLPGRQLDARRVERDIWRLRQWERERMASVRSALEPPSRPAGAQGA